MVGLIGAGVASCPARSPAVCASGPAWRAPWCSTRRSSCSTSPTPGSTRSASAYLNQLIIDLNAQIDATFLIVTHDIDTARSVPDNIGLLFHRDLAMFGPREMLLSSEEPVVRQFLNAQRQGPIGMAEEKDADELAQEEAEDTSMPPLPPIPLQLLTSDGKARSTQREPGEWCRANGVTPPPGSFESPNAATARPLRRSRRGRLRGRPGRPAVGTDTVSNPAVGALRQSGNLFALGLDVLRRCPDGRSRPGSSSSRPGSSRASRSCPTALVAIPFGAVIALQLGNLTRQLGAQSFTGSRAACSPSSARPARSSPRC